MNISRILAILVAVLVVIGLVVWYAQVASEPRQTTIVVTGTPPATPIGKAIDVKAPLGLPPLPVPKDNPLTEETVALGRRLYYEKALSVDNTVSCASCHHPDFGFSDGKSVSTGVQGKTGTRNSPTVFNSAYFREQFWDGRAPTLEKQAEGPVANPVEMAHSLDGAAKKLQSDPGYVMEFERAFGFGPITYEKIAKAIAAFERTVISANSPFDRYYFGGQKNALSASAQRGFEIFRDPKRGNCAVCHTIGEKDALFTDNKYHNIGVGVRDEQFTDIGRFEVTKNPADRGAFKTPSLRNVALTAPYLHDGSLKTLKDVIDLYIGGGNSNPHLDKEIHALDFLTGQERKDLLAFLESLTGEMPKNVGEPVVASKPVPTGKPAN